MQVRTLARSLVIVVAALALLAVLSVSGQSAETVKLKMADSFPTSHYVVSQAAKPWMDRVVQLSKTKVEFQYFPSEQLGKQSDMVNLLRTGVAEVVYTSPTGLSGDFPLHTFFFLPNLFGTCTEGTRIYQQMLKEGPLLEEFTKKGARPLFLFTIPTYEIFTVKKAVVKMEDVNGLKIRSSGGYMDTVVKALGAVPVQIPAPDISTALQRGTVDGATFAYVSAISYRLEEQVKYATLGARLSSSVPGYAILEQTWQRLPVDVREAMTKASEEIVASATKWQDDETMRIVSTFEKAGVKINRLSKDEMARWEQTLAPLIEQWAKDMEAKGLAGKQVVDAYKKATGR